MDALHQPIPGSHPTNALWNPSAAANWSLLFTPVFGSYLHEANWKALDESMLAAQSLKWLYATIVFWLFVFIVGMLFPPSETLDMSVKVLAVGYLVVWYYASARPQARYVKERFGESYIRRK
jgi:hypothetical protein